MITASDISARYPRLFEVMEAMASDSDLWIFGSGPVFESERVALRPEPDHLARYRTEHELADDWTPPAEVSLDELELLAERLPSDEVEEFAAGEHVDNILRTNRLGLHTLDIFLEECFDGSLAQAFRGELKGNQDERPDQ